MRKHEPVEQIREAVNHAIFNLESFSMEQLEKLRTIFSEAADLVRQRLALLPMKSSAWTASKVEQEGLSMRKKETSEGIIGTVDQNVRRMFASMLENFLFEHNKVFWRVQFPPPKVMNSPQFKISNCNLSLSITPSSGIYIHSADRRLYKGRWAFRVYNSRGQKIRSLKFSESFQKKAGEDQIVKDSLQALLVCSIKTFKPVESRKQEIHYSGRSSRLENHPRRPMGSRAEKPPRKIMVTGIMNEEWNGVYSWNGRDKQKNRPVYRGKLPQQVLLWSNSRRVWKFHDKDASGGKEKPFELRALSTNGEKSPLTCKWPKPVKVSKIPEHKVEEKVQMISSSLNQHEPQGELLRSFNENVARAQQVTRTLSLSQIGVRERHSIGVVNNGSSQRVRKHSQRKSVKDKMLFGHSSPRTEKDDMIAALALSSPRKRRCHSENRRRKKNNISNGSQNGSEGRRNTSNSSQLVIGEEVLVNISTSQFEGVFVNAKIVRKKEKPNTYDVDIPNHKMLGCAPWALDVPAHMIIKCGNLSQPEVSEPKKHDQEIKKNEPGYTSSLWQIDKIEENPKRDIHVERTITPRRQKMSPSRESRLSPSRSYLQHGRKRHRHNESIYSQIPVKYEDSDGEEPQPSKMDDFDVICLNASKGLRQRESLLVASPSMRTLKGPALDNRLTKKRNAIYMDFLDTERVYVQGLVKLKIEFFDPIFDNNCAPRMFKSQMVDNVLKISTLHKEKFLPALEKCCEKRSGIPELFSTFLKKLEIYQDYVSGFNAVMDLVEGQRVTNERFKTFLADKEKQRESFYSYLISPVQRIPQYKLLLESLLKATPEEHEEHEKLKSALEKTQNLCMKINEHQREIERKSQLMQIQSQIQGLPESLLDDMREYVTDCLFKEVQKGLSFRSKYRRLYLFSDVLIMTGGKSIFKSHHPLESITVVHRSPNKFTIMFKTKEVGVPEKTFMHDDQAFVTAFTTQLDHVKMLHMKELVSEFDEAASESD